MLFANGKRNDKEIFDINCVTGSAAAHKVL